MKNYIPGMTTSNEEHHKKSSTEDYEVHDIRDTQATSENQQQQSGGEYEYRDRTAALQIGIWGETLVTQPV